MGVDTQRVIDGDVDDLVCELRYVAGPNVVPPPVGKDGSNIAWWARLRAFS
jgi:hypothetical protein